jgi:hypothetical protein
LNEVEISDAAAAPTTAAKQTEAHIRKSRFTMAIPRKKFDLQEV